MLGNAVSEVVCLYFDRAVWLFATSVLEDVEQSTKRIKDDRTREATAQRVIQKWLNEPTTAPAKGRFADPAARIRRG